MKLKLTLLIVFAILLGANPAVAQWAGTGDLAYSNANGNTNTSALAAALDLSKESGSWKHAVGFQAIGSSQDNTTTAESYTLLGQSDYTFSGDYYGFGALRYQTDRFSGFESRASAKVGGGWHAIDTESTTFDAELGVGYRKTELLNNLGSESEAVVSISLIYKHELTDTTDLDASYFIESGSSNRYSEASAGVRVAISDALGMRAGYLIKQNSDVPVGRRGTDTLMTIGLNYQF